GQQCTAILHMLLLENLDPLLMDQPEDNLDNAFIADRIVTELRSAKIARQFLFATHNANIPVFGDAEWIGVFKADENRALLPPSAQGAIDLPGIQKEAAEILEGGKMAFIQRKEKYGF
ncbi:ATPase, partial [Desulfosarcina sp.]|nr:ATPase [Desulfosarcina sp.]